MIPAFIADRENRKRRGELDDDHRIGAFSYGPDHFDMYSVDDTDFDDDDDEDVLECKGGSAPKPASPMEEARAQMELERQRNEYAAQQAEQQRQREAAERQATIDKARGIQSGAYNDALNYGREQIGARGFDQGLVDRYGLGGLYNSAVNRVRGTIGETDLNPGASYNTDTMFNDALNTALGTYRGDLRTQLNSIAGENYGYNTFADTADDAILQQILDQGRADALAQIDAAKARGQLNDQGYSRALTGLDTQGQAGMADLQDLGMGVLKGYRDQLDSLRNNQLDAIGNAGFNNPYDFGAFQERLGGTVNDLNSRLSGDIYRAAGDKTFFDPSTLISGAGAIQGFYNPNQNKTGSVGGTGAASGNTNPLLNAFQQTDDQTKKQPANGVF